MESIFQVTTPITIGQFPKKPRKSVSNSWQPICVLSCFSHVRLFVTLWTTACQAVSMVFSRQEQRNGLPCPPPRDLPDPGMEPTSLLSPALAGRFLTTSSTWEALIQLSVEKRGSLLCSSVDKLQPQRLGCRGSDSRRESLQVSSRRQNPRKVWHPEGRANNFEP